MIVFFIILAIVAVYGTIDMFRQLFCKTKR